jgi:hypothetical protein
MPEVSLSARPDGHRPDAAPTLAEIQLAQLRRLADIGLDLADALRGDVLGAVRSSARERAMLESGEDNVLIAMPLAPVFPGDIGLTFGRLSRAIRLTLALQTRILRGLEPRPRPG